MIRQGCLTVLILTGCSQPQAGADTFNRDPDRVRHVVAHCDRDLNRRECETARAGLAEARRRDRMAAYAERFGEP